MGIILCSKKKILGVESRDFSQAEKEITACKAEQIHKMTTIITKNGPRLSFLSKNSCHFLNLHIFPNSSFFLSMRKTS